MSTVEIESVGAVSKLTIPLAPGIVCLTGKPGAGKSTALAAVDALIRGKGRPDLADGAVKGSVAIGATKLNISRTRNTKSGGELSVSSMEAGFDLAGFVNPGFANEEVSDKHRIAAIVRLTGQQPDSSIFAPLLGEGYTVRACKDGDLLDQARQLKLDLQSKARDKEAEADNARIQYEAKRQQIAGVDLTAQSNTLILSANLEKAIKAEGFLAAEIDRVASAQATAKKAKETLHKARTEYTGPTVEEADQRQRDASKAQVEAEKKREAARKSLDMATKVYEAAVKLHEGAMEAKEQADAHEKAMAAWQEQVDSASQIVPVDPEAAQEAMRNTAAARKAVELGVQVCAAMKAQIEAKKWKAVMEFSTKEAENLRKLSDGVDGVLSGVVTKAAPMFSIREGRLMVTRGKKTETVSRLSDGERAKLALSLIIDFWPEDSEGLPLIVIPQGLYESFPPSVRKDLAADLVKRNACAITAQVTDDEELTVTK